MSVSTGKADNPLTGKPPAPDQFKDPSPEGREPNEMVHQPNEPGFKKRPSQYPATRNGGDNIDLPDETAGGPADHD